MKKLLIGFLLALTFVACKNDDENWTEDTAYMLLPRQCKFIEVNHAYRYSPANDQYYALGALLGKQVVKTNDYLLLLMSSNHEFPDITEDYDYVGIPHYVWPKQDNWFTDEPDANMEQQIRTFLKQNKSLKSASLDYTNLVRVEYRKGEVKSLKIASTATIFDIEAGKSLNNKIEIFGTPVYHSFLFTHDKQLIGSVERGWSIDKYLSYRPIASASLYLRFTSTPTEAPLETRFIVEMEMEGGTILRDTTDVVNLLP